jgi:hypothetical protein
VKQQTGVLKLAPCLSSVLDAQAEQHLGDPRPMNRQVTGHCQCGNSPQLGLQPQPLTAANCISPDCCIATHDSFENLIKTRTITLCSSSSDSNSCGPPW